MDSKPSDPFCFPGDRVGCLLLHGFSASPEEMRFLGERLAAAGFSASGVCLTGHGTSIDEFRRASWHDWLASAEQGLAQLADTTDRVVVVGQSMGGLLALHLAAQHADQVAALALLAPALRLARPWLERIRPVLPLLVRRGVHFKKRGSDIASRAARDERFGYSETPAAALLQLLHLQRATRRLLPQVAQPILAIQSPQDHTVSAQAINILKRGVRGQVEELWLRDSFHVVSVDVEKEQVADAVTAFAARWRDPACASA
jgi:carboxylesterase